MDESFIETCMEEKFLDEYLARSNLRTPVDALQTLGHVILHEVSLEIIHYSRHSSTIWFANYCS
jgi:hypothetical protein